MKNIRQITLLLGIINKVEKLFGKIDQESVFQGQEGTYYARDHPFKTTAIF